MLQQLRQFYTEARSEFKKISWPTLDEIKGSTSVVCVTIGFVMILLAVYDLIISHLMELIIK